MSTPYEALNDQTFQQLVQAILVAENPRLTSFPVGMPDGGRDAMLTDPINGDLVVYQVKFARNPWKIEDPFEWLTSAIDGEVSKVEALKERGLTEYVLVTNISGSSHLDVGLMDKASSYLGSRMGVSSRIIWRDDLDRRLDTNFTLKMRYPQLLNGPDLLRLFWEYPETVKGAARRSKVLQSYLRDQYDRDRTIRFKQVELLSSSLLDLFIDVPVAPSQTNRNRTDIHYFVSAASSVRLSSRQSTPQSADDDATRSDFAGSIVNDIEEIDEIEVFGHSYGDGPPKALVGAADLMTSVAFTGKVMRIVIEGAPGQGKSTLSQYLAQVQRIRLLNKDFERKSLPPLHANAPVALPIKLELRDVARWLRGVDPWTRDVGKRHDEQYTLESAIAGHIARFSGGQEFTVDDLVTTMSERPVILILDALDEVADLADRQEVVSQIEAFTERHQHDSENVTVIVTSRPTAISNAPSLPPSKFYYLTLSSITGKIAKSYAQKWAKVRRLPPNDVIELTQTLEGKLRSPHMAELAKNTMQLTILLSLMVARGSSLPDKRTELYTAYLDQFLNRESEKSPDVRDNRDLLLDIHGYLGYYLHAQAESKQGTGRISVADLRTLLREYLARQRHKGDTVDKLFNAVVGRVVALVPRIEGTFEFEVQPLREYFAGRYLYETAPTSPPWEEARGTRSDRFDGISANPYWLNVTRFFAGFFRKGELADLALRVKELIEDPSRRGQSYPRQLAFALLQDWVFAQSPRATQLVVSSIFQGEGLYWTADTAMRSRVRSTGISYGLSRGAGSEEAFEIFWNALTNNPRSSRAAAFCHLIQLYGTPGEIYSRWFEKYQSTTEEMKIIWASLGLRLGCGSMATQKLGAGWVLSGSNGEFDRSVVSAIMAATQAPSRMLGIDLIKPFMKAALDSSVHHHVIYGPSNDVYMMILAISHPSFWSTIVSREYRNYRHGSGSIGPVIAEDPDASAVRILDTLVSARSGRPSFSLEPWIEAVSALEREYGRTATSIHLGVLSAGISSLSERGGRANSLLSEEFSLPARVRYARRRAKSAEWWDKQFSEATTLEETELVLTACLTWVKPDVLLSLLEPIDMAAQALPLSRFTTMLKFLDTCAIYLPSVGKFFDPSVLDANLASHSSRAAQILIRRVSPSARWGVIDSWLLTSAPSPETVADVMNDIVDAVIEGRIGTQRALDLLENVESFDHISYRNFRLDSLSGQLAQKARIPLREIIARCENLPPDVSQLAWEVGRMRMKPSAPVTVIARDQGWFSDSHDW